MRESIARRAALGTGVLVVGAVALFAAVQQRDTVGAAPPVTAAAPLPSSAGADPAAAAGAPSSDVGPPTVPPADDALPPEAPATPPDTAPAVDVPALAPPSLTEPLAPTAQRAPASAVVALGERVYREQRCGSCHSIAGVGSPRSPLDGVGNRLTAAEIRLWIVDPQTIRPGVRKPTYDELPAEQVEALVVFIQSLR